MQHPDLLNHHHHHHRPASHLYAEFMFNSMSSMRRKDSAMPAGTQSLHRRFSLRERGERHSQSPATAATAPPSTLLRTATLTAAAATAASQLQLADMTSAGTSSARRPSVSSTASTGDSGFGLGGGGRGGGLQQYRSRHDYLYAMTEDLADWLNFLYDRDITVESFFADLANGALLCGHACQLQLAAEEFFSGRQHQAGQCLQQKQKVLRLPPSAPRYRPDAQPGSFHARDNIAQFIAWCRSLGLPDCLLFETEDLVARKNTRHVILCLLEVARAGAAFGVEVPELVRFEREIDEQELSCSSSTSSCASNDSGLASAAASPALSAAPATASSVAKPAKQAVKLSSARRGSDAPAAAASAAALPAFKRRKTRWQCDLKSLDELVRELINECTCEQTFPMKRLDEGKYLFGDSQMLIFVRVLRNHVMVRVGGGWDSLEHLLLKHDPCRSGGSTSRSGVPVNHQEERQRRQQQRQSEDRPAQAAAPAEGLAEAPPTGEAAQKKDEKFVRPNQPAPKKASAAQQQQQQKRQPVLQQKSPISAVGPQRRNSLQPRRPASPAPSPTASPLATRRQPPQPQQQKRPAAPGSSASRNSKK